MYLVPKINLFHALKLGPQSKESANFFNKVWDQDSRFVPQVSRLIQRQGSCAPEPPTSVERTEAEYAHRGAPHYKAHLGCDGERMR